MSGAEIGPNDIIIHLVNPFKCLDCGTEFFHKNSFLKHLAEHMDKLKAQHPCYQIVSGVNLAAQQTNSITVTKDILQINENQMFELQDSSVDYTQLPPLKTLEQAGILHLPAPEKVLPLSLPKLPSNQPFGISIASQPILQQGLPQQNMAVIQGQAGNDNVAIFGKSCGKKQVELNIDLNNLQNLEPAGTTPVELQTLVQQTLMNGSGIKEESSSEMNISNNTHILGKNKSSDHFSVLPKIEVAKGSQSWTTVNNEQCLEGVKHVMVFKEMPETVNEMSDRHVECNICFHRFASKNVLMRHQVVHSGEKPHHCFKCLKQFNDLSSLAKHVKIHKRSHQCPVCLKMFLRKRQMELHLSQHKKKRFIQFGHKYHEVQVSTSRNACGQVVHEFSLSVLMKKVASQDEPNKDVKLESGASSKHDTAEERIDSSENVKSTFNVLNSGQELNTVHQPDAFPSGTITFPDHAVKVSDNVNEIDSPPDKEHDSVYKVIYRCGHCKKYINTRPTLSRHLMLHTNEKPFRCEQCGKQFRHKSDLVHHYKTHSKPVKCLTCGSAFSKELYLQNHLQKGCPFLESDNEKFIVLPDLRYQCNLCSKVLKTKANVVRHLRVHAFNNKESDSKKISKNIDENVDQCKDGCSSDVTSENASDYIKPLDNSVGFLCTLCGEEFRFKSFILIHVRMHLGQRLFKCKECGKGFYGRYMLRKHQQNHTRPYKCPKCGKGFNRRYLMSHHFNKSHNEEAEDRMKDITFLSEDKLLHCDICGKTMKSYQKSLMQYHIRLHKDVRPHQCKVCQKGFISDIALKKHSLNHTKPYMCQVCNKGFSRRYLMLDHFEKSCKNNLKKQEEQSAHEDRTESKTDIFKNVVANQVIVLKVEDAIPKSSIGPYQAETITEIDETTGREIFRCAPCDKTFAVRDALSRHVKTFMKATCCKYCQTVFEDKHLTLAHQRCCLGVEVSKKTQCKALPTVGEKQEKVLKTMKEMNSKIDSLTAVLSTDISNSQKVDIVQIDQGLENVLSVSSSDKIKIAPSLNQQTNAQAVTERTIAILREGSTYQCPNCDKSFGTPRGLRIHAASHVRLYKCEICGLDFTQVGKFRLHLKSHDTTPLENGNKCDSNALDEDDKSNQDQAKEIQELIAQKLKSSVRCDTAEKETELDNNRMDTGDCCDVLLKETSRNQKTENGKVNVLLLQSGTRGRPFSCHMCRKRFTEQSGLQNHLSHNHGVK